MTSNTNKRLDRYFKEATRQTKKKQYEIDIDIDIDIEVDKNHKYLANAILDFHEIEDSQTKRISAFEINKYAQNSISKIESRIVELVNNYPKYYWKFYLTAFPKEHFRGRLDTSFLFSIKMVESSISFSEKDIDEDHLYKNGNTVCLEINESVLKDYCKLVGYSMLLRDMYTLIRISSKGCEFTICKDELMPSPFHAISTFESIELFDKRNVIESKVESGLNMPTKSGFSLKQKHLKNIDHLVIVANENERPSYDYVSKKVTKLKDKKYTILNFNIVPINLETIYSEFNLGEEKLPWKIELLEIVCILQFITNIIIRGGVFLPDIVEKGYLLFAKGFVNQALPGFIESVKKQQLEKLGATFSLNTEEILQKYKKPLRENIYPANSSLVFDAGKMIGFDLSSSFEMLFHQLEYTKKQGNIANLRGTFFETQTQDFIDKSKLLPPTNVRGLVSKTLKLNKKAVTDFDSILVHGKYLVAISCKSMLVNEEYDKGEYKAVRNTTTAIEKYVEDWRSKMRIINENLIGDNYDFTNFEKVIGLVLTPNVLYLNVSHRKELQLPGLFESMSSSEFIAWINKQVK
jgi:hypothetical protein